jgi:aldehyde dehydrogenase (NAD+)
MVGNTVVLKPASLTPRTALMFTELLASSGLPRGVVNCVTGGGGTVGAALVGDPRIKAISFTGLEMGGKNPAIVLPDADLDLAVAEIVKGAFACSGQWCTSTSRVIVLEEIAAELTERLVAAARAIVVRDGANEDCGMGPVCGAKQKADVLEHIVKGRNEGARLVAGGNALAGEDYDHGCFIAPTVFDGVTRAMSIAREEIFGPVLVIMTVRTFDEAVEVANDVAYGLSSSIFTNDLKRALTYMERAEVGLAHVNLMSALKEPQLSFGGVKESGAGLPEAGSSGIEFFTHHKVCYVKYR